MTRMTIIAACLALLVPLGGCALVEGPKLADYETPDEYEAAVAERAARLDQYARVAGVSKAFVKAEIERWAALGVDIDVLDENSRLMAAGGCATLAALTEVVRAARAEQPDAAIVEAENALSDEALDWCFTVVNVLGPAPGGAPEPATKPAEPTETPAETPETSETPVA